jgi:hypothetical protein
MTISQVRRLAHPIAAIIVIAAPMGAAVTVSSDDLQLSIGALIQARVDGSKATDGQGHDYSIESGNDLTNSPTASFYLRRARIIFKGIYQGTWGFNITFRNDGAGKAQTNTGAAENPLLQQAFIYRLFKSGDFTQQVQIGQDYAWHNRSANVVSSAEQLLPNNEATNALLNSRAPGVGYRLSAPWITFGADIQNNTAHTGGQAGTLADEDRAEGLFYSARIEFTPEGEYKVAKDTETFVGKKGTGFRIGADVAYNQNARVTSAAAIPAGTPNSSTSTTDEGIDGLFHWDGLTVLAESRWDHVANKADAGGDLPTSNKQTWFVQAGYAFPVSGIVIEPALRYQLIDLKTTTTATDLYNGSNDDWGSSGRQIDVGVNFYWAGNASKTQLEYTNWRGDGYGNTATPPAAASNGTTLAKASIIRLQEQIAF